MSKKPNFYFRNYKLDARDIWHDDYRTAKKIMYKRIEVGVIKMDNNEKYKITYQGNALKEELKHNPNYRWTWRTIIRRFDTQQDAMDFITSNATDFFNVLFDDIKNGTYA